MDVPLEIKRYLIEEMALTHSKMDTLRSNLAHIDPLIQYSFQQLI